MNMSESYRDLACIFSYPEEKSALQEAASSLATTLAGGELAASLAGFAEYISAAGLAEIQEEYVRTFDFNPLCAPYIGHHLHGDTYKKGLFMIALKEFYREHDFVPSQNELPDHLATVFDCAARLDSAGNHAERKEFVIQRLSDGISKMHEVIAPKEDLHFRHAIAAANAICLAECEEVNHAR